jgi:hypothetical protein
MAEVAVNVPLDAEEIKAIICAELRKRLDSLGPLQLQKEYARFDVGFNLAIRLYRAGEATLPKETLAWGSVQGGEINPDHVEESVVLASSFESGDPNTERQSRGMPLTVETKDGKGGVVRRRVTVKE